ncbi:MAG: UDP-N-acetylmuramate--L-alanine ligase [Chlamydiota bacterium]
MYHFLGIGGVGMSALATILLEQGEKVSGHDRLGSDLVEKLKREGASISPNCPDGSILVYSSAIEKTHPLREKALTRAQKEMHRSQLLKLLMQKKQQIVIAGAHGKTTISSLIAFLLWHAKKDPSFAIGGFLKNLGTNGRFGRGEHFVAEGDESDGSFLASNPDLAIVSSTDEDHLEFWGSSERLEEAYRQFCNKSKKVIWCADDPTLLSWNPKGISYGFSEKADARCLSYAVKKEGVVFTLSWKGAVYQDLVFPMIGKHSAANATAAFVAGKELGLEEGMIREAFAAFAGISRRQERIATCQKIDFFDDYAHHPTEIRATLASFRERYPLRRLIAVFEPHRKERIESCKEALQTSFEAADLLIVTDLYDPKRGSCTKQSGFFDTPAFAASLPHKDAQYVSLPKVVSHLQNIARPFDLVVFLGAGALSREKERVQQLSPQAFSPWKVGLIFGGPSPEHEVSLESSRFVLGALQESHYNLVEFGMDKEGGWHVGEKSYPLLKKGIFAAREKESFTNALCALKRMEIALPITHGRSVEDGRLQGFLETLGLCLASAPTLGSALAMNKAFAKDLAQKQGIATGRYLSIYAWEWEQDPEKVLRLIENTLTFPIWVKACSSGSSLEMEQVLSLKGLPASLAKIASKDEQIIVEEHIVGREIEVGVFGFGPYVETTQPGEIFSQGHFHTYEGKYGRALTPSTPSADLAPTRAAYIEKSAKKIFQLLGLSCFARIDFFLTQEGEIYFNEVNTIPGLTKTSLFPDLCSFANLSPQEVTDRIIMCALYVQRRKNALS